MMIFSSKEEWKNYCFNTHKSYIKSKYFSCWTRQKRIDIFNYASLQKEELKDIMISVKNALKFCGTNFKIKIAKYRFRGFDFNVKKGTWLEAGY